MLWAKEAYSIVPCETANKKVKLITDLSKEIELYIL